MPTKKKTAKKPKQIFGTDPSTEILVFNGLQDLLTHDKMVEAATSALEKRLIEFIDYDDDFQESLRKTMQNLLDGLLADPKFKKKVIPVLEKNFLDFVEDSSDEITDDYDLHRKLMTLFKNDMLKKLGLKKPQKKNKR